MSVELSVVICTHNRAEYLGRVLHALLLQDYPHEEFEVLVVDNASADDTSTVCETHRITQQPHPRFEYVHEPRIGLSLARNTGVTISRGAVVAFIDDDATPDAGWASHLMRAFADPGIGVAGGKVDLAYEGDRPEWMTSYLELYLTRVDLGPEARLLDVSREWVAGANIAFRREILTAYPFNPTLGRTGSSLVSGEETELCLLASDEGWGIAWAPEARVAHSIPQRRATRHYLRRRAFAGGYSAALLRYRRGEAAASLRASARTVASGCARALSLWLPVGSRVEGAVLASAGWGELLGRVSARSTSPTKRVQGRYRG